MTSGRRCRRHRRAKYRCALFPQITDLGERLIATGHLSARGAQSGGETRTRFAYVVDYENRKATLVRAYLDHGEALEAAGLSE
jgi:hypothetical protein